MATITTARQKLQHNGRIRIVSDYKITGDVATDEKTIPQIIAQTWAQHQINVQDSQLLYDYYHNKTSIDTKFKEQRSDINNQLAIPRAFEIQRKINSYANGLPREYTCLVTEKQKQLETFNKYQLNECKHSKTQLANAWASISGVGYYCVLPDYDPETYSSYEIYDENFTPLNTYIIYENGIKGREMMGINHYTVKENKGTDAEVSYTVFNVFTKYHQWIFKTANIDDPTQFIVVKQQIQIANPAQLQVVDAIPNAFGIIPIIQVNYHPFRMGIYEIVLDLIDCANMFLSGDADLRQQAVDYILVLTDCEIAPELVYNEDGTPALDADGNQIEKEPDITNKRYFSIRTNGNNNQAKVEILNNKFDYQTTIDFIDQINGLIEKIVGIPTRKNQDVGGNSSTGTGAKNENGMRDLDDNADIIQAQALLSERKFINLVLAIDKNSPTKELAGLDAIDVKVSFPRNEQENIITSAQAYSTCRASGMNDIDSLKASKIVTDVLQTAKRNKAEQEEKMKQEQQQMKVAQNNKNSTETIISEKED